MKEHLRVPVAPARGWAMAAVLFSATCFSAFVFWILWNKPTDAPRWVIWAASAFMAFVGGASLFSGIPFHLRVARLSRRPEARFLIVDEEGLILPVQILDMLSAQRLVSQDYACLRLCWENIRGIQELRDTDGPDYYEITTDLPDKKVRVIKSSLGSADEFYRLVNSRAA